MLTDNQLRKVLNWGLVILAVVAIGHFGRHIVIWYLNGMPTTPF